ncbi:hypothetical protein DQ04_10661040 [Trypanosoma grayi]|uniref:hypothetical protein n=1 Tax=Trypanosoma grayi TaxID=71804 RepID=UPI0004F4A0E1|nr:hypothetical protein DQ04_10661040 [Trypanosoma grayi]KEG07173.1 hypothetical protein DQ04_10661040 [Trypanosoma grayi]
MPVEGPAANPLHKSPQPQEAQQLQEMARSATSSGSCGGVPPTHMRSLSEKSAKMSKWRPPSPQQQPQPQGQDLHGTPQGQSRNEINGMSLLPRESSAAGSASGGCGIVGGGSLTPPSSRRNVGSADPSAALVRRAARALPTDAAPAAKPADQRTQVRRLSGGQREHCQPMRHPLRSRQQHDPPPQRGLCLLDSIHP